MGRDFVGVWAGLHPLFALLLGGDPCCFLCLFGGLMIAFAKEILTAIGAI